MKIIYVLIFISLVGIPSYGQELNTLSPSEKIFGLSKFWQEANYNFANFDNVPKLNWDSTYSQFIPKILATTSDFDYFTCLMKFCALLKDAHTRVFYPGYNAKMMYRTFGEIQLYIENIENKAIVVRTNVSKNNEIPIGSEIIEVNGQSTQTFLENNVIPTVSASNDDVIRDWAVRVMFWGFPGTKYEVKIQTPKGDRKTLFLTLNKSDEKEFIPPIQDHGLFNFKWLKDGIAYVALNSFHDPKIDTLFKEKVPELRKAKGLILDMRENDGGNSNIGEFIAQYFINDTLFYSSRVRVRKNIADYKAIAGNMRLKPSDTIGNQFAADAYNCLHNNLWEEKGLAGGWKNDIPENERLIYPVVILMGHETGSAAENVLLCFDKCKQIIKMGEHTNGSTGQAYMFNLPGGALGQVCTRHETYPDGRRFLGCGIKPDKEVKKTIADVINDHDPVFDEALKYLRSHK